jgi:ABC-type sugar transport system ATPase subunit
LSGVYPPDRGQLIIEGCNLDLKRYSVRKARKLGIETVYQERSLGEKQSLSLNEADKVMKFMSQFVSRDKSCIYISHNMNHVHYVAHRIVIMDRGKIVRECLKDEMTLEGLGTKLMRIATSTCLEH